jgi:hypothetical protein
MTFGLELFSSGGNTTFSTTDVTWNQVDYLFVPKNSSASGVYPAIAGREVLTVQMFINSPPTDREATAHTVTVDATTNTVTATGGSEDAYIMVLMR